MPWWVRASLVELWDYSGEGSGAVWYQVLWSVYSKKNVTERGLQTLKMRH